MKPRGLPVVVIDFHDESYTMFSYVFLADDYREALRLIEEDDGLAIVHYESTLVTQRPDDLQRWKEDFGFDQE